MSSNDSGETTSTPTTASSSTTTTTRTTTTARTVSRLIELLKERGQPKKKLWWEKYLKNEIEFYGVPMEDIRRAIAEWKRNEEEEEEEGDAKSELTEDLLLLSYAWELMRHPVQESKMAGILILQNDCMDAMVPHRDLPVIASLFQEGYLHEWHSTDWLCVRVLGKLVELHGSVVVDILKKDWIHADNTLWQRRAALVTFVYIAKDHRDTILELATILSDSEERFAQTAIGWSLRSLSETEGDAVVEFLEQHRDVLSREAMRMASAKLTDSQRRQLGMTGKRRRR